MTDKFDRFTKRARRVLQLAQEEAQRLNHNYIGTEHLLLGLVREENGVAVKVLQELGVEGSHVVRAIERTVGRGERMPIGKPNLAPRTKRVLELAIDEARLMGHHYIGTEHLLLGLVREGDGIAVNVLRSLGVNLDKLRTQTARSILQSQTQLTKEKQKAERKTPMLDQLGLDLTALAEEGKLDRVIGREKEIERVVQILCRRTKNNPALIGEPGVGKTAIVEGLAQRIVEGNVPELLLNKRVLTLDVGSLVAGTMYRGQFEERLKKVIEEIKNTASILFIDEVHMLVGAGSAGSSVDAANILKPALSRGELQCIGATTLDEYRRYIEGDAALERRFQPVQVFEPTIEETVEILRGVKGAYETHHKLEITEDAIHAAATLAARYVVDRFLPDKAIDVIDEAASRVRMYKAPYARNLRETFVTLKSLQKEKEEALNTQRYDDAIDLRYREVELEHELDQLRMGWEDVDNRPKVMAEDVAEVVSMWTGIPLMRIAGEESARLLEMEQELHRRVVGQQEAIDAVSKAVRRARAGLKDPKRPIATLIFLGPTGVGKTLLAKTLAEFLFGSEEALIKIDMSEFMERHNVSRLVGAPPGYIGYEEGGQLTEAVRRRPYSVVLLDEIEKAHPEVFNMLLQIMEDGHLSDAKGRRVDFRNAIIIMTSNVGAQLIKRATSLGFIPNRDEQKKVEDEYQAMRERVTDALKKTFRPEFLNRVDGVMVFRALTKQQITDIVDLELKRVHWQLSEHNISLQISDATKEHVANIGYDPDYGARPLRRAIQNLLDDPLSEGVLAGRFSPGDTVLADYNPDTKEIELKVIASTPAPASVLDDLVMEQLLEPVLE
ncbi:ATP-dependent Clp protease ATP-binding subunit [Candidatus Amarolinea aalborgensis]|jgi:ATP-dependent Clp protease ATP-binding subunit ClpC|uniref:ATP-dependent Clp protease ATP-binding subunit n=1 Tax=Candidatus Amarolinea aalborgensis TaxID=2249329 RepID=UPI003BF973EC